MSYFFSLTINIMSNNYTQLCSYTEVFTKEEAEYINDFYLELTSIDEIIPEKFWNDYKKLKDELQEEFENGFDDNYGINIFLDPDDNSLCYIIEESGNIEWLAQFLQYFLKKFNKTDIIIFEYSNTCSKMRFNEFGGGAVRISKDDIFYLHTSDIEDYYQLSIDRG